MVFKRVRGWTLGRSLPVLNFVKYPPGQLVDQNTVLLYFLLLLEHCWETWTENFWWNWNNMNYLSAGIFTAKLLRSIIENSLLNS